MPSAVVIVTGRGDRTPLRPVIDELRSAAFGVSVFDLDGLAIGSAASYVERRLRSGTDVVVILGDRFEALAAATVATVAGVPIAHIHGGETTLGSFDNQLRDALTKLAHIHFVAHQTYADKVISLGEDPARVHVVGAPGLDNLTNLPPRNPARAFVVTYHPATLARSSVRELLMALRRFPTYRVLWTAPNNDPGRFDILQNIGQLVIDASPREYIAYCRRAAAIIGNSSSGIIEAPTLQVPTVNIGTRQTGRLKGPSVIDCDDAADAIEAAINTALAYTGPWDNPYGGPGASAALVSILAAALPLNRIKS